MMSMEKFEFYPKYSEISDMENVKIGEKKLDELCYDDNEICLGVRVVGNKRLGIFYMKDLQFCAYPEDGSFEALCCSNELKSVVDYINNLKPENLLH